MHKFFTDIESEDHKLVNLCREAEILEHIQAAASIVYAGNVSHG